MIVDLLTPPMVLGGMSKKCADTHPIHVSNLHAKFGWISYNGLGGDSIMDRLMDGQTEAITITTSLFLKKSLGMKMMGKENSLNFMLKIFCLS